MSSSLSTPILYIKPGCPWCREAMTFFSQHGVEVSIRDVTRSKRDMQRMVEVSGQSLTPTFEFDEFVVADFSVEEFLDEIEQVPEMKRQLGFGDEEDWN
ncbi:MAG: glutathione S-transferase N-terminal domain-containing protein [Opitutales bacterium]|nr:glutathione S-transferase N-terminal domain-containing protein [Opitutales bacterium]